VTPSEVCYTSLMSNHRKRRICNPLLRGVFYALLIEVIVALLIWVIFF